MNTLYRVGPALRAWVVVAGLMAAQAVAAWGQGVEAKPFLHPLFTDNMVVQRGQPVPIWGWAEPGEKVTVQMHGQAASAVADAHGKWMARLGPFTAGGPFTLTIVGPQTVMLTNVLVGDVWLCSGQSNMEMGIGNVAHAAEEIANANYPQLRLFTVAKRIATAPVELVATTRWDVCTSASVARGGWGGFSAAGYFFGRDLLQQLNVPIGLIHSSWGGTVAEAWTSAQALAAMPDFGPALQQVAQMAANPGDPALAFQRLMTAWYERNDPGSKPGAGWSAPALDTTGWPTMNLPQNWEQAGLPDFDGVVWFRQAVEVPAAWANADWVLHLGPIDDMDTTWVNGVRVGGLNDWLSSRDYRLPAGLIKPGRNLIAVRVLDTGGNGGIYGKPDQMRLETQTDGGHAVALAGPWVYRASVVLAKATPVPQPVNNNPNVVTVLYNGMIAPLLPFPIKGVIWYQGESNAGRARQYRTLLPTLIRDWRTRFEVGAFPFLIVQLANFMPTKAEPGESAWAELREAQLRTATHIPKCGLAVAIDIGDAADIHPKNKQELGRRLALDAEAIAYGLKVEYSGPRYRSMKREGNRLRLRFDHARGGLLAKGGGPVRGFAVAGADGKFVWADATIEGNSVLVSAPGLEAPVAVRYAWADNPVCNLCNQAGLPASPFRTDAPK